MSRYKDFAIVGTGTTGSCVVRQLLKDKAARTINEVVVLTPQESGTPIDGDARVIPIGYSSKEFIKYALAGIDVVVSALPDMAPGLQPGIAEAAKEAGVKLVVPSEFGEPTEGSTEGQYGAKAGIPYVLFYTGSYTDIIRVPLLGLDVTSRKVLVGGDGNMQIPFTSRTDVARYLSSVLAHLPAEQLSNRSFTIAGDTNSFNEIFEEYEAKTGKKLDVTDIPVSDLDARLATNPQD